MTRIGSFVSSTLALGALGVVAAGAGCSSAPEGDDVASTSQASSGCQPPFCAPELTAEVTASDPAATDVGCTLTLSTPIAPLAAGCTLGGAYTNGTGGFETIWACPASTPTPPPSGTVEFTSADSFDSRCLGTPLPGWKLILEWPPVHLACNHGCPFEKE